MLNTSSGFSPITNTIIMDVRRGGDLANYEQHQLIAALTSIIRGQDQCPGCGLIEGCHISDCPVEKYNASEEGASDTDGALMEGTVQEFTEAAESGQMISLFGLSEAIKREK